MSSHLPTDIDAEFFIDGAYTNTYSSIDLGARIRGNDSIRITRGLVDQQSAFSSTSCSFTLNMTDGLFSTKNPYSPLYGKFGRNVRARLGVKTSSTWDEYLRMPDFDINTPTTGNIMYTVDKNTLDVVGDIDIRFEITPDYTRYRRQNIASKWNITGNQRLWMVETREDGTMALATSPDGTLTNALTNVSTVIIAENSTRVAYRVTLDVNDGAGNRVYRWYTSDSISGTWTQVATTTTAGVTTILGGTANVEVGSANGGQGPFTPASRQFAGKIHAFELRDGINGTLVADFKPSGRGVGQVSWTDTCATPNVWLYTGSNIRLGSDRIRFTGELSALPQDWDLTGTDRWVNVTAQHASARYSSSRGVLGSAIYRNYRNYPLLYGYWTCEDQAGATSAGNAVTSGSAGDITSCVFGSTSGLDGTSGALTLSSAPDVSAAKFRASIPSVSSGASTVLFYFKMDSLPATDQTLVTFGNYQGTTHHWRITISNIAYSFKSYGYDGTLLYDSGGFALVTASPQDQWIGMQLSLAQEGANVRFQSSWHAVGSSTFYTHTVGGTTYAGTLGKGFLDATFATPDSTFAGMQIAHVIISGNSDLNLVSSRFRDASKGYSGETAGNRMKRVCLVEEGIPFDWHGDLDNTLPCGSQGTGTVNDIMVAAAGVDGGLLGDGRDTHGYRYATRRYLGNRKALSLSYDAEQLAATPKPVLDDRYTVNDFTANRPSGSFARYVADDGRPLNVSNPDDTPAGVGRYERSGSFSAASDSQLAVLAQAQVAIGTWDEFRIPGIAVGLHRSQIYGTATSLQSVVAADFGTPVTLTGLTNKPLPPDDLRMLTFGYTETISNFLWDWVANTVPQGPYTVQSIGDYALGDIRLDADYGQIKLYGAHSSGATSLLLRVDVTPEVTNGCRLIDTAGYAAEFPASLKLGGEQVTMTACTTATSTVPTTLDGTFESGVAGFTPTSCTLAQSAVFAFAGTKSALLTVVGSPALAYWRPATGLAVVAGASYTFSEQVRSVAALTNVRAAIDWFDVNGAYLSTSDSGGALASGAWEARSVTDVAPAGAVTAKMGPTLLSSPATGSLLYTDAWSFTSNTYNWQTATVTRAVNGVAKAQADGEEVSLWQSTILGMQ